MGWRSKGERVSGLDVVCERLGGRRRVRSGGR
jgi:hypothetical protein